MHNIKNTKARGFTLVELLVVIAIIAVLATLSFSVITKMVAKSRTVSSVNNLKQLYIAAESFAGDNRDVFPATTWDNPDTGQSRVNWWAALGPHLYNDYNNRLDGMFRDKADPDTKSIKDDELRPPKWREISYMPWANGTVDNKQQVRGISLSRTNNLSKQPYLTTAKNTGTWACESEEKFNKYVMPSAAWRNNTLIVLYCDGSVQMIKNPTFEKVAPDMAEEED